MGGLKRAELVIGIIAAAIVFADGILHVVNGPCEVSTKWSAWRASTAAVRIKYVPVTQPA